MADITEINDYTVIKTLADTDAGFTFLVVPKGLKGGSEDYYKILKMTHVEGKHKAFASTLILAVILLTVFSNIYILY